MIQREVVPSEHLSEAPRRRDAREAIAGLEIELLDLVQDAVIVRDLRDATIRYWNRGAEALYGWSKDEAIGRVTHELLRTVSPHPIEQIESHLIEKGSWAGELVHTRRDGSPVTVASRWVARSGGRGRPTVHLEVNSDLTARKQVEAELIARMAAETAMRTRNDAIRAIVHDLRNPLTAIRGQVQLLQRRTSRSGSISNEMLERSLNQIAASADRAREQLDEVLDTSRLQVGEEIELRCAPTDLLALVREAATAQQAATERHTIRVNASEAELLGLWDARRLRRVLDNVFANAIKYSPGGGAIIATVSSRAAGAREEAVLIVQDEGIGIPQADLPHVFDRYHRGGNVRGLSGSGIGLAGSRQIVEQHGGSIEITSAEGQGTCVTIRLPVSGAPGT